MEWKLVHYSDFQHMEYVSIACKRGVVSTILPVRKELEEETGEQLFLFYMNQRKGAFFTFVVNRMKEEDEPEVREWLKPRWLEMKKIWEPFE